MALPLGPEELREIVDREASAARRLPLPDELLRSARDTVVLTSERVAKARDLWVDGQALDAGKLIFESLPVETRPLWAARVLRLVIDRTRVTTPAIEHAMVIANTPGDWFKAHDAFSRVRQETLAADRKARGLRRLWRKSKHDLLLSHLVLAELVAKVTYNSTNPADEFDEDSGWRIAPCLRDVLDLVSDEALSVAAWSALSSTPQTG